ncbi:NADH-quinone oxidoreductase subunit N [Candidatus Thermoflexus japonica]|uniref:NADH-quinone oxidoreductase subunit N n=1 Tax=Candidatus Thermoflexus japonica TaxID=2035417 RepID=A0A2H5Y9J6_9CHLR|nr:NADH-quinone oxidoreductase subunit N [Candidatus Thermoflexus japonica]
MTWWPLLPTLVLTAGALGLLLVEAFRRPGSASGMAWGALGITALTLGAASALVGHREIEGLYRMVRWDPPAFWLSLTILIGTGLAILLSRHYLADQGMERGEYYVFLLLAAAGMLLMTVAADLLIVFLALEWLSFPLYVLAGFARPRLESEEAALKYFLLGAFASAFLVFGIALIFAGTGLTNLRDLAAWLKRPDPGTQPLVWMGGALLLVALGFKVAAVPFHLWTPDVYEGAPTPVTGFMAAATKTAAVAALIRVFLIGLGPAAALWSGPMAWMAAATMLVGNGVALMQSDFKRMMAYSSIAHAGYLLMGLLGDPALAIPGVMFYLLAYTLATMGAFAVAVGMVGPEGEDQSFRAYTGVARRSPGIGTAMALFMLSLIGVPPTAGFFAKLLLFAAAWQAGWIALVMVGIITTVISAYFYLRIVVAMWMGPGEPVRLPKPDLWVRLSVALAGVGTLLLGVLWLMISGLSL